MEFFYGKSFYFLEWNIINFSHWDNQIHDKVITSQWLQTNPQIKIELYPRGLSGKEEHLEVQLCSSGFAYFTGEVSFIGFDGSILCTLKVKHKEDVYLLPTAVEVLHLTPGPNYEKVVTEIRKNKTLYNDQITLQYRFGVTSNSITDYMCTTIDVMDIYLKVSSKVLQNSNVSTAFSKLYYSPNDDKLSNVFLEIKRDELNNSKILLTLSPNSLQKKFLILTSMIVLNNEDEVRTEENEHIFRNMNPWTFSNSLTIEDFKVKGYHLILNFKITPSIDYKQSRVRSCNTKDITTIPPHRFRHPVRSIREGACNKSTTALASNQTGNSATMLATELMCLYQDQDFSDFQLKCGTVTFPVHKAILSARSPVFKTMFSADMRESVSGSVDIEDLDVSTLSRFLAFLYTGKVEDLQCDSALKLYYAADKYQVPSLKRECVSVLCAEVSVSNVCDILSLANKHHDDELTGVARDFILKHYNEVLGSEAWEGFMKSDPLLAVETLTHFAKKNFVEKSKKIP